MKRTHLTKFAAVFTALLVLSVSSVLPVLAGSLTLCTAEVEGEMPPFEILAVEGGMAGSGARAGTEAGAGNTVGEAVGNAAEDIGNAVEDILPGNDPADDPSVNDPAANDPAGENRNPSGDTSGSGNTSDSGNMTDNRDDNAGNGNREEGQAGGDANGEVGDGTNRDTTNPDTDRNPTTADENTAGSDTVAGTDTTAQNDRGMNWASIIVALLIAVALVVVIVALIPRKRTD